MQRSSGVVEGVVIVVIIDEIYKDVLRNEFYMYKQ
jgi:hypothetical protein